MAPTSASRERRSFRSWWRGWRRHCTLCRRPWRLAFAPRLESPTREAQTYKATDRNTEVLEKLFAQVDVTEEFPFLMAKS